MTKAIDLIPIVNQHKIYDSTKIQQFLDCPRAYFYEYVLGWRPEAPNVHLEFGKAWHLAMEYLLLHGYSPTSVYEAWVLLEAHYRKYFTPEMDGANAPKNPGNALGALAEYVKYYREDKHKTLYTEIAGTISINDEDHLHFRMDSILETDFGIKSREHKTGSQLSRQWTDQWRNSVQCGTYNHVLYCLFSAQEVWGVEINGSIFNKTKVQFQRVPARRSLEMMQVWLSTVNFWVSMIKNEMRVLFEDCTTDDPILQAFPLNPQSCTKYFGCRYIDYCTSWPNPLRECTTPPMGFTIEHWDPTAEESKHQFQF